MTVWIHHHGSVGLAMAWALLILAGLVGILMVVVGMFEELPGIISATWGRMVQKRPS
jgi:hypothetical protein